MPQATASSSTWEAAVFHGNIHRHLLVLSLVNWGVAIVCWTVSAYLGVARPTNLIVYTVLFVVGLFAVIVAIGSFVLADFGTEPEPAVVAATVEAAPAEAAEAPADEGADRGA
jgi:hypothetical protein